MMQNRPIIIGLTGGTGCGKTTVCSILKKYKSFIIDSDVIAHSILKKDEPAYNEIIQYFGNNILKEDSEIDRKALGKIVFSDKQKLDYLNKVTHKYILKRINDEIQFAIGQNIYDYIVIDAPLLIETGLHNIVDKVWIVHTTNLEERIKRLKIRDNISEQDILNRIKNQTPFEKNRKFADFIIYNEEPTDLEDIIKKQLKGSFS